MKTDWHECIQRHLAGVGTNEETAELQAALKSSGELRALYLDYMNLDMALGALADAAKTDPVNKPATASVKREVRWRGWRPLATAAACAALLLTGVLVLQRKPSSTHPDLTAVFASAEDAIAQLPAPSLAPLPDWMSPTEAMLDPGRLRH